MERKCFIALFLIQMEQIESKFKAAKQFQPISSDNSYSCPSNLPFYHQSSYSCKYNAPTNNKLDKGGNDVQEFSSMNTSEI